MLYPQEDCPTGKPPRLPEEEYRRGMLKWVKFCHDVVPVGPCGRFYLPTRHFDRPCPGPWFIGGQAAPFMDTLSSLCVLFSRETGLTFLPERFKFLVENRYFLNGKGEGGIPHDALCKVYGVNLTAEEIGNIKLAPEEYVSPTLTPFGPSEIKRIENAYVRQIFLDLWCLVNPSR
jgi:hypothetical protein